MPTSERIVSFWITFFIVVGVLLTVIFSPHNAYAAFIIGVMSVLTGLVIGCMRVNKWVR